MIVDFTPASSKPGVPVTVLRFCVNERKTELLIGLYIPAAAVARAGLDRARKIVPTRLIFALHALR